jgi:uncharacterized protein YfaS (alpha-2-macroglobulin family)
MSRNRRSFLTAGAVAIGGTLAGCGSGGDEVSQNGDTGGGNGEAGNGPGEISGEGRFGVSNLTFTAERADGYDSYTPQPDASYGRGETVWLYFGVDGLTANEAGDGYTPEFIQTLTVTGPQGDEVLTEEFDFAPQLDSASQLDAVFVTNDIALPDGAPAGEYDVEFELTDELAGTSLTESATFTLDAPPLELTGEGEFGASNLTFCAEQPADFDDYTAQPDAVYEPHETVWVYFEINGATAELEGESHVVDITQELRITNPDGDVVVEDTHEFDDAVDDIDRYAGWNRVRLPGDALPGVYEVAFDLTDTLSGATATGSGTFTLRRGEVITEESFDIEEFVFCSEPPAGHDDYARQSPATYAQGDSVWMYADFVGENYEATADGQRVAVDGYLKIENPDGVVTYEDTTTYSDVFGEDGSATEFFVREDVVATSDATTGEYTVTFRFTDVLSDTEATAEERFSIEEG